MSQLFNPEALANPYPLYERLRALGPVTWSAELNGWLAVSYDAVNALARSPHVSVRAKSAFVEVPAGDARARQLLNNLDCMMISQDPPAHTRLRGLVNKAFTPAAVEAMRGRIEQQVEECLDRVQEQGRMDVIADLGGPLPVQVIVDMLGVPVADARRFREWSDAIAVVDNWVACVTPQQLLGVGKAVAEFNAYLKPLAEERRRQPRNDLLSTLVQAEEAGDRLAEIELYGNTLLLLVAGHETTTNLIGNGTLALLRHLEQLQKLRDDPALTPNAVEELLRYDSPAQIGLRNATADIEIAGNTIRKGQRLFLLWGAANRDPAHFPEPNCLDITRSNVKHMSFGAGAHYCLGAPLARLEGQIAIAALVRRFPNLKLATEHLEYNDHFNLRGLKSLPVMW